MFSIDEIPIGSEYPPYIVAEISANHNGSLERALATIDEAKRSGANAVKLQTYTPDTITIDCDAPAFHVKSGLWSGQKLYDLYKRAHTPFEWHETLFKHCHNLGITVFSTPFDETAVDLLESLRVPAYKISSFEIIDLPLIRYVAQTGKPMIISTGTATEQEIDEAVDVARDGGCRDLLLLHCISGYPAPIDQMNLRKIRTLTQRFGLDVGLSDHSLGVVAATAAIALGACLIEKHFTLNRQDNGPDSEFSLEPGELELLCRTTNESWRALGKDDFLRPEAEKENLPFRRSIFFIRDLPAGAIVTRDDIRRIRPGGGLAPKFFDEIVGRRLAKDVKRGDATKWELFESKEVS